ncbi:MAG TPA: glycosyltransferase family 39 protein [Desulfomonilaceae bacterium]|nr:glycosyltransferase family 39 protein [Desulfomonilaceae bacterium]
MGEQGWKRISAVLKYVSVVVAALYLGAYVGIALLRIRYPYAIEWLEGLILDTISRSALGHKIFQEPSVDFVPHVYTPLYYYVSAQVSKVFGFTFLSARSVSFVSSLGCFGTIYMLVKKETHNSLCAFLSCCLFAATFKASSTWFDTAKPDSLFLFLVLLAVLLMRQKGSWIKVLSSGLLMALAYLCKQTALVISLPMMFYFVLCGWRRFLLFAGATLGGIALSQVGLDWYYDGWYSYYTWDMPNRMAIFFPKQFIKFWTYDLLQVLPVACIAAVCYALFFVKDRSTGKESDFFFCFIALGMVAGACSSRSYGSNANALLPAYAALSILCGIAADRVCTMSESMPAPLGSKMLSFVYVLWLMQFASLAYDPARFVPTNADLVAGQKIVRELAEIRGDTYIPDHSYLSVLAGKKGHVSGFALFLMTHYGTAPVSDELVRQVKGAIRHQRFAAIVTDGSLSVGEAELNEFYEREKPVFDNEEVFWPVSEFKMRPRWIYIPRSRSRHDPTSGNH